MLKGAIIHFYCLFDESHFSNICALQYVIMEHIQFSWLCKHMKKIRQSFLYWIEWIILNYWIFPVSIINVKFQLNCLFKLSWNISASSLHALSHSGVTNFSKRGNFKSVWNNLVYNKIQVTIQDKKITYYKIEGFLTINYWRPIVLFIHSSNFNSEILILYLSFLIYIYKHR